MCHQSPNVVAHEAKRCATSHNAILLRRVIWSGAALALLGSMAGCARRPAARPVSAGEALFAKMCAGIDGVSRGIVSVEDETPRVDGRRSQAKRTFRLVFDDSQNMLRCDFEGPSRIPKGLVRQTKYARTPTESLFQYIEEPYYGGIEVGAPDRDLSSTEQQPLEPHLLWFGSAGGYGSRPRYSDIRRRWLRSARDATVSPDQAGRLVLSLTREQTTQKWVIDPALGFVPVRNEIIFGTDQPVVVEWTEIRYEKKNGSFVPVGLEIHENGGSTIKLTCHWESVNESIDPKVFTVDGFEPRDGTAVWDVRGSKPVLRAKATSKDEFEKSIAEAMGANKPLDVRLQNSLADARLFENNVLAVVAWPKSDVSYRLFSILRTRDPQEGDDGALKTLGNFTRLLIDASSCERAAELKAFLARWKLAAPSPDEALLAVVDPDGHLLAATTSKQLWPGKREAAPLTAFLTQHQTPLPDAARRLADALARAKRENKRVLVEQSAAFCGWCHVLARYLDRHRSLIEKDYVWIMIDRRFANGDAVINKLRPGVGGGIPWMVILDSDGKPLITSEGPEGNLGYPGEVRDQPHFEKMWRTTAQRLSDAQIKILLADVLKP